MGKEADTTTPAEQQSVPPSAALPRRAITNPREVAAVVAARMNLVNAKKDDPTVAIHGLVDVTQQLARVYAEQLVFIEQLRRRVKALEAAGGNTPPAPTVQ
jgi:hypothetical protein